MTKQSILAFLFLMIYFMGFSHGVIPHCQSKNAADEIGGNHHHHEHHEHSVAEEENSDDHVVHNDHLDNGVYDFIICLISDLEHEDNDCNMHLCAKVNLQENSLNQFSKAKLFAVVSVLFNIEFFVKPKMVYSESISICISPPFLKNISHRGPPIISC